MKNKFIYLSLISLVLIIFKLINPNIVQKITLINYDFYQKVFVSGDVENITIIDIDEKSLAKIGQFPWRRDVYSKIINNLNPYNPLVIAFDIVFSEKDRQNPQDLLLQLQKENEQFENVSVLNTNKIFNESLKNSKSILAIIGETKDSLVENNSKPKIKIIKKGEDPKNYLYKFRNKITSLEEINNSALGIGSISLLPSIDGIVRSVPILLNIDDKIWPSLSLEAVRLSNDQKNLLIQTDETGIKLVKTRKNIIPTDKNAIINVKFKNFDKENYISAVDIIENNFDKKRIEKKVILIGSSAQALFDIVKIANGKVVPGVEVHAHTIDNILNSDTIIKGLNTVIAENIFLILTLTFLIFVPIKTKPKFSIIFFVGYLIAINLISIIFFQYNYYIDALFNTICGTIIFMSSLYFRYLDENTLAVENEKKQLLLKKEREIAGEVQKKLFPTNKEVEKYIYARNTPAKDVSGDYYDYFKINDNEIYFILGDVTGKGIKAGILMANAAAVFRSLTKMNSSVSKTALFINNQVKDSSYQAMFITAILGKINIEKQEMEFVNMGHEPMMVLDENYNFNYIKSTLPPMGLMAAKDETFFKTSFMNIKDKTLLIYTDGVTEGYVEKGKELTVPGLENEIKNLKSTNPKIIIDHVTGMLLKNNITLRDDITCLGISI